MPEEKFDVTKHGLVPRHTLLSEEDTKKLLANYNVRKKQLPQIKIKDPAIQHLTCKPGDVIKIERKSETAGEAVFFRLVV